MAFATDITSQDVFQTEVLSTPGVLQGPSHAHTAASCCDNHPMGKLGITHQLTSLHGYSSQPSQLPPTTCVPYPRVYAPLCSGGMLQRLGRAVQGSGQFVEGPILQLQ